MLGPDVLGRGVFSFDVEIVVGEGSYVCGEETALLNAIEGRRPEVRVRPPYPGSRGLYGRPTLVNNVETLVNIPWIVRHGGDAYAALGRGESRGTKVVSLNSLFARPGLYEVELGVPLRHIVEDLGGGLRTGELAGVIVGGPLAGVVPPALLDVPFTFEDLYAHRLRSGPRRRGRVRRAHDDRRARAPRVRLRRLRVVWQVHALPGRGRRGRSDLRRGARRPGERQQAIV